LSRVGRGRDVSDVTKLATATAQGRASDMTKASNLRGVLAANRPSGWWAMSRVAAVAAPVSANHAYAAHLERDGDRPISAVAATRKRHASMAGGGGPCRLTSSVHATTLMSGNVCWTFPRASCKVEEKGAAGITLANPPLGGERGSPYGAPPGRRGACGSGTSRRRRGGAVVLDKQPPATGLAEKRC
jgi:hypothetical protein